MLTGGRLFLLYQQLRSKKPKHCKRCSLPYDPEQKTCPHCTGLTERQVEALTDKHKKALYGTVVHLILVFCGLAIVFALMRWLV